METALYSPEVMELARMKVQRMNAAKGSLKGYDCPLCLNRGYVCVLDEQGYELAKTCRCMAVRQATRRLGESGAAALIERCSFENFTTAQGWQARLKAAAEGYLGQNAGRWLFIGGQSGSGKTHLCTAVFAKLLHQGMQGLYMLWRDEAGSMLRSGFAGAEQTARRLEGLKTTPLLYIDDLFKTDGGGVSQREAELAFELVNHRYNNGLVTLVTSEHSMEELAAISQAVAGRICERCTPCNVLDIERDDNKNYRFEGF